MKIGDLNPWWITAQIEEEYSTLQQRNLFAEIIKYLSDRQILVLSGLRRTGKTVTLHHLIEFLLKNNSREKILYFNFDLFDEKIESILKQYSELVKVDLRKEKIFVFLDEVQKHHNWENELKLIYDNFRNIKFFISGSSTLFIEKKTKESLAGRAYSFIMEPLTFSEYLKLKKVIFEKNKLSLYEEELRKHLLHYLVTGGFPELISEEEPVKISRYLKETVIDKIVYLDIPRVFKIEEPALLESIFSIVSNRPGIIFNYDSLASDLKRNRKTISNYVLYLEKAFLVKKLYNYSKNILTHEKKLKKFYPASTAFSYLYNAEEGRIIENAVNMNYNFKFFSRIGNKEVDFVEIKKNKTIPIEVKYQDNVAEKDIKGTLAFMKNHALKKGLVITKNLEKTRDFAGGKITFLPLWKWLLEK
ncbi:MAG: ATP-binding protein [Nanoarchaeota archaeon]